MHTHTSLFLQFPVNFMLIEPITFGCCMVPCCTCTTSLPKPCLIQTYSLLLSPCNTITCAPAYSFYCSPPFPIPFSIPFSLSSLPSPLPLLSSPLLLPLPLSPLSPSNHPFLRSLFPPPLSPFHPPFSSFPLSLSSYPSPSSPPFPLLTLPLTSPTPHPHAHNTIHSVRGDCPSPCSRQGT